MAKKEQNEEMTLEESRAYRFAQYKPKERELSSTEKREAFRLFWAQNRKLYKKYSKDVEQILWIHLMSIKKTSPENFQSGIENFGLKKAK